VSHDRPRDQGRRPGGPAHARARRGRGPVVRGRGALGLRILAGGKNRSGRRASWPGSRWVPGARRGRSRGAPRRRDRGSRAPPRRSARGAARPGARGPGAGVETQGPRRRQATGLDSRRFSLVAAVLDRPSAGAGRCELYGASAVGSGRRPRCDLASRRPWRPRRRGARRPQASAFVGEVTLTGLIRPAASMPTGSRPPGRPASRRCSGTAGSRAPAGARRVRLVAVRHVRDALRWAVGDSGSACAGARAGRREHVSGPTSPSPAGRGRGRARLVGGR
jgi:hypothetical protein